METYYGARATLNSRLPAGNAAPVAFNSGVRHLGKYMGEFAAGLFRLTSRGLRAVCQACAAARCSKSVASAPTGCHSDSFDRVLMARAGFACAAGLLGADKLVSSCSPTLEASATRAA